MEKFEKVIAQQLKDRFAQANNSNKIFNIVIQFYPLFFRPHIQSAIEESKSDLLKKIENNIKLIG